MHDLILDMHEVYLKSYYAGLLIFGNKLLSVALTSSRIAAERFVNEFVAAPLFNGNPPHIDHQVWCS